jgi:DNA (cytosine-5)-methyltransferase 1
MMGLPDGWVTCTPGPDDMSPAALRNAMLKALGNGVVRQQAAAALRLLLTRAGFAQAVAA